jgi:hypothetical protein
MARYEDLRRGGIDPSRDFEMKILVNECITHCDFVTRSVFGDGCRPSLAPKLGNSWTLRGEIGKAIGCRKLRFVWFLSVLALVGFISSCRRPRFSEGVITSVPTSIGSDWVNIPMADPLIAKWEKQTILVEVDSTFQVSDHPLGIRLADGSIAVPEAELITKSGQKQPLRLVGLFSGDLVLFDSDQVVRGSSFSGLRIRSPKALNCFRMTWISHSRQDSTIVRLRSK